MKRRIAPLLLLSILVGLLSGCSGQGASDMPFTAGAWSGDHYDSAFLDLRFTLPEGWDASGADQLADMSAAADKALDLQKGGTGEHPESIYHYELSAKDPETGAGVLVLVNAYSASATDYTSGLQKGAEAEGASYTVGSTETVTLAGRRYLMVPLTMEGQETPYQRQYVRKDGDYLITVMLFAPTDSAEAFTEMEGFFTQLSRS